MAILADDNEPYYREISDGLRRALAGLLEGQLGDVFGQDTTVAFDVHAPAVDVDISSIDGSDVELEAAVLTATWNEGFAAAEAAHVLADAGLGPHHNFYLTMDELWRAMRGDGEIVDIINDLLRTDRQKGMGELFISHSMGDLDQLATAEARAKARGFVERVGMIGCFGLPQVEFGRLADVVDFSSVERREVVSWAAPPSLDTATGRMAAPPGRGKRAAQDGQPARRPHPGETHQRRTPRRRARHEQALAPPGQGRVSTATQTPKSAQSRVQLTTSQRYELDLLALGDAARLAQVWEHALSASYRLGEQAGYRSGWLAGRDEEALAWQAIVTGYSAVMSQPTRDGAGAATRAQPLTPARNGAAPAPSASTPRSSISNLAHYGSPDFPGTGHLNSRHTRQRRSGVMSDLTKRPNDGLLPLITLLTVVGLAALAWWPITLIAHVNGEHLPLNPAAMAIALAKHRAPWPGSTVLVLYAIEAAVAGRSCWCWCSGAAPAAARAAPAPTPRPATSHARAKWSA